MISRAILPAYEQLIALRRAKLKEQIESAFPPATRFVCEIGSGHGHFLTAYAKAHLDEVCVGIDIIGERVARANRKRDRAQLKHLHFFHAEARLFLETLPAAASISKVFILFPDPWPKTRHHKHRIMQSDFLTLLRSRVAADAEVYFRTDHRPYFDDAYASVQGHDQWRVTTTEWPFEHETVFQKRAETFSSFSAAPRP
jgi:tRNA (guanine-N7-)-methyltransferase